MVPDPLAVAIAENVLWCERVAHAVGLRTVVDEVRWWTPGRMPPFHPDAVSLVPGVDAAALVAALDRGPGCSVKDSHGDVDLVASGFSLLLTGTWWHRPPRPRPAGPLRPSVAVVGGEVAGGALAGDPEVRVVVAADGDGRARGHAVLHEAGGVLGVSNLVAEADAADDTWRAVLAVGAGRHVVGWEVDDALPPAVAAGCEPLGPLRVWHVPPGP